MKDNLVQVFNQVLVAFIQTAPDGGGKDFEKLRVLLNVGPEEEVAKKLLATHTDYMWIGSFDFFVPSGVVTMTFSLEPKKVPHVVNETGTWEEFEMRVALGANFKPRMGEREAFAAASLLQQAATCAQGIEDLLKKTKIHRLTATQKTKVTRRTKSRDRLGAAIRQIRGLLQVGEEREFEAKKPVVPGMGLRVKFSQKGARVEYKAKGSTCGTKILIARIS